MVSTLAMFIIGYKKENFSFARYVGQRLKHESSLLMVYAPMIKVIAIIENLENMGSVKVFLFKLKQWVDGMELFKCDQLGWKEKPKGNLI